MKMKSLFRYILTILLLSGMTSCLIENDMSYPKKEAVITSFEVEGQKSVRIDPESRHVEVVLEETADMTSLKVKSIGFNEGVEPVNPVPEYLDLSQPVTMTLMAYKEYVWTISAVQPIERYIHVENQVGEASFNAAERTAFLYVTEYQP